MGLKRGALTEKQVLFVGRLYANQGVGYVAKHDPPSRVVNAHDRPRVIYTSGGDPDFFGHWHGDAFVMEAKEVTRHPSLQLCDRIVKRSQVRKLVEWSRSGAAAYMLVSFRIPRTARKEPVVEAYLWRVRHGDLDCPFQQHARQAKDQRLPLAWFREHATLVHEKHGGLAWGEAIDASEEQCPSRMSSSNC